MGPSTDINALKARLKATWEAGDFGQVARYAVPAAEEFMGRLKFQKGDIVLDAACGTGNLAVIAARAGCVVSGVDIAANLIAQAKARAQAEELNISYAEGDAEALPYPDNHFNAIVSMFGVMFAPRPERVAAELLRVTKPGGYAAMANWTPEGFIGKMFQVFKTHLPQPTPDVPSTLLWGEETTIRERLKGFAEVRMTRRMARLRYPFTSAATVEFFRKYYGPTQRAFAALDETGQVVLRRDLETFQADNNVSEEPNTTEAPAEYMEIVAFKG